MAVLLSSAYLPPVAWVVAAVQAGDVCLEIHETFPKQTCRNRCTIYGPNGKQSLTIPVNKPFGNHTKTKDIRISYDIPWDKLHWKSLETAYRNSPFFLYYQDELKPFYHKQYHFLIDFNDELMMVLFHMLRAPVTLCHSSSFMPLQKDDPRIILSSKHHHPVFPAYIQTFSSVHGFLTNLSVVDLLFNLGNETLNYLKSVCL